MRNDIEKLKLEVVKNTTKIENILNQLSKIEKIQYLFFSAILTGLISIIIALLIK